MFYAPDFSDKAKKFKEETNSVQVDKFWRASPPFLETLKKAININPNEMIARVADPRIKRVQANGSTGLRSGRSGIRQTEVFHIVAERGGKIHNQVCRKPGMASHRLVGGRLSSGYKIIGFVEHAGRLRQSLGLSEARNGKSSSSGWPALCERRLSSHIPQLYTSNSTTTSTKPSLPKNIKFLSSELDKNEDNSSSGNNFDEDSVQEELGGWEEMGDEGAKVNKSLSSTNIQNGEWPAKHSEGSIEMEFKDDENSHEVFKTTHSPTKEDILMILEDDEWSTEDSDTDPENDENDQVPKIQLIPQSIQSTSPSIKKPTDIQQESIVDDSNDRSEDLGGWGEMGVGQISTYG
ncbi:hypothetical protein G9A89_003147 [Geosiphon pyriformis]|nr:hypothetical protein G9A89_003147 [Geosiphon pyriformis]